MMSLRKSFSISFGVTTILFNSIIETIVLVSSLAMLSLSIFFDKMKAKPRPMSVSVYAKVVDPQSIIREIYQKKNGRHYYKLSKYYPTIDEKLTD
jgi:hypothetical protein